MIVNGCGECGQPVNLRGRYVQEDDGMVYHVKCWQRAEVRLERSVGALEVEWPGVRLEGGVR